MNPDIDPDNTYTSFKLILLIMDIIVDCLKFIERNLHDEYINPDFPTTLNIVENGRYCVVGYLYVDVDVEGGDIPIYDGSYNVIPSKEQQILETKDKKMIDDVTIEEISYTETSNQYGTTVAIATI